MCGRFTLAPYEDISLRYGSEGLEQPVPRYNIAPGQNILCVLQGNRTAEMHWGIRPYGKSLINARMETIGQKAMFSRLLDKGRCLVPATGFYEWDERGDPFLFSLEGGLFSMAGLVSEKGDVVIITRPSQGSIADVHQRMPCVLYRDMEKLWLAEELPDIGNTLNDGPDLTSVPVSKDVNDVMNDGPELLRPLTTLDVF